MLRPRHPSVPSTHAAERFHDNAERFRDSAERFRHSPARRCRRLRANVGCLISASQGALQGTRMQSPTAAAAWHALSRRFLGCCSCYLSSLSFPWVGLRLYWHTTSVMCTSYAQLLCSTMDMSSCCRTSMLLFWAILVVYAGYASTASCRVPWLASSHQAMVVLIVIQLLASDA